MLRSVQQGGPQRRETEKVRDLGEKVAVMLRVRERGPGSGIDVDYRFVPAFTFRDGKIVRTDRFADLDEALEAAGLSE